MVCYNQQKRFSSFPAPHLHCSHQRPSFHLHRLPSYTPPPPSTQCPPRSPFDMPLLPPAQSASAVSCVFSPLPLSSTATAVPPAPLPTAPPTLDGDIQGAMYTPLQSQT